LRCAQGIGDGLFDRICDTMKELIHGTWWEDANLLKLMPIISEFVASTEGHKQITAPVMPIPTGTGEADGCSLRKAIASTRCQWCISCDDHNN
jgi:hypothetical protein